MYDKKFLESSYAECLKRMRNGNRKQYYYGYALKLRNNCKERHPEHAEEIQRGWEQSWYRKFRKALV